MNLRSAVERLERYAAGGDPCPECGATGARREYTISIEPSDEPAEPEYCGACERALNVDIGGDLNGGG